MEISIRVPSGLITCSREILILREPGSPCAETIRERLTRIFDAGYKIPLNDEPVWGIGEEPGNLSWLLDYRAIPLIPDEQVREQVFMELGFKERRPDRVIRLRILGSHPEDKPHYLDVTAVKNFDYQAYLRTQAEGINFFY